MTPQRLAEIREWHQRRAEEGTLFSDRLASIRVGELLAYVDHLEGLLADCEQSGEFQAGAAAERKAICGLIDALCCEDSLGDHPYRTSIETWLAVLKGEIGKRGPVPQDALPLLAELREATDNERNHVGIWDSIDDEKRRQVMGAAMLRLVAAVNKAERLEKALEAIWWDVSAGMDMVGSMQPHDTIRQTIDEALGRTTKEGM